MQRTLTQLNREDKPIFKKYKNSSSSLEKRRLWQKTEEQTASIKRQQIKALLILWDGKAETTNKDRLRMQSRYNPKVCNTTFAYFCERGRTQEKVHTAR